MSIKIIFIYFSLTGFAKKSYHEKICIQLMQPWNNPFKNVVRKLICGNVNNAFSIYFTSTGFEKKVTTKKSAFNLCKLEIILSKTLSGNWIAGMSIMRWHTFISFLFYWADKNRVITSKCINGFSFRRSRCILDCFMAFCFDKYCLSMSQSISINNVQIPTRRERKYAQALNTLD